MIESIHNDHVIKWQHLQNKKYRDETNEYLVETEHLVKEAIKSGYAKEIICLENYQIDTKLPVYKVTKQVMQKISSLVSIPTICAVCEKKEEKEITGNVLILDGIQDPGNLGTIIRSAIAFNFQDIILSLDTVDLYNPKVIRSCEGMNFHTNIIRTDIKKFITEHKNYIFYATDVSKGTSLHNFCKPKEKIGIVIGSEGKGVKKEIKDICNYLLNIPMNPKCESLNAAISASILMYEVTK